MFIVKKQVITAICVSFPCREQDRPTFQLLAQELADSLIDLKNTSYKEEHML